VIEGVAIVLQARMGSSRLPGKVLAHIAGRTVLEHCIERLRATSGMPVILATTTRQEDDRLEQEGARLGVQVVRGPDEDVLARFVMVASRLSVTHLIRATADDPAVDMDSPRRVWEALHRTGADHVLEDGLPYGTTVEAMSVEALLRQASLIEDDGDREHVTLLMRRDPRFNSMRVPAPEVVRRPDLRFTVDTPEDLEFMRAVFAAAEANGPRPVPLAALIAAAERLADDPVWAGSVSAGQG
jgi:spore coat polysaccharide biosynthesis protein SpsF